MKQEIVLKHEFVEFIPGNLTPGTIYISTRFGTVVTPLRPTDWKLIFDGKTVSLDPSIGNWSFPCRSHYWIRNNRVQWAESWSSDKVRAGRAFDAARKNKYFDKETTTPSAAVNATPPTLPTAKATGWQKIKSLFGWK
jgi:hypothetical protein